MPNDLKRDMRQMKILLEDGRHKDFVESYLYEYIYYERIKGPSEQVLNDQIDAIKPSALKEIDAILERDLSPRKYEKQHETDAGRAMAEFIYRDQDDTDHIVIFIQPDYSDHWLMIRP